MKRKNVKGLALSAAPKPPPDSGRRDGKGDESQQLEIGIEYKLDLRQEDLETVKELGSGNGGTVSKVKHVTTGTVMARKVRRTDVALRTMEMCPD
jgi:mitogen-activated protein kinase kinase